mgnify:FL=1
MGELPPLHTPQGPGVPRASRPGFPRVDSSGTSSAPSSRSASFPFLASGSRRSPPFVPHSASRFVLLPLPRVSPRASTLTRFLFSPLPVRLRFPQLPPPFSPVSFPILPLPFVQFSPVLSTFFLFGSPVVFPPTWRSDSSPISFRISGSAAALSRLGFCGPQVAPKRPHTTPEKRQS